MEHKYSPKTLLSDREAGVRYERLKAVGKKMFANSGLVLQNLPLTENDLQLIENYHRETSPSNPDSPFRQLQRTVFEDNELQDPSFFSNWEAPAGTLEHIHLATQASKLILDYLRSNLKDVLKTDPYFDVIEGIRLIDSIHLQAATALHDEGRQITHLFLTNELIGRRLLQAIGIREDIRNVLPSEEILQIPQEQDMKETIRKMNPEAILVRLADDLGKRNGKTNQIWTIEAINDVRHQEWADLYTKRPKSLRPTDDRWRKMLPLHTYNAPRYWLAIDNWIQSVSTITLQDLSDHLDSNLSPTLKPFESGKI